MKNYVRKVHFVYTRVQYAFTELEHMQRVRVVLYVDFPVGVLGCVMVFMWEPNSLQARQSSINWLEGLVVFIA